MSRTYAVTWHDGGARVNGRLELEDDAFALSGSSPDGAVLSERVPFGAIDGVRITRSNGDRSLAIERRGGVPIVLTTLGEAGALFELADRLAESAGGRDAPSTLVVVPIRRGSADAVRRLVAEGPPFDVSELGVERHRVFVSEREAVFLFDGGRGAAGLREGLRGPALARALARWRPYLAGAPRVGELGYSWPDDAA